MMFRDEVINMARMTVVNTIGGYERFLSEHRIATVDMRGPEILVMVNKETGVASLNQDPMPLNSYWSSAFIEYHKLARLSVDESHVIRAYCDFIKEQHSVKAVEDNDIWVETEDDGFRPAREAFLESLQQSKATITRLV